MITFEQHLQKRQDDVGYNDLCEAYDDLRQRYLKLFNGLLEMNIDRITNWHIQPFALRSTLKGSTAMPDEGDGRAVELPSRTAASSSVEQRGQQGPSALSSEGA